jgi:nucleoside-diphosphate-sugar epimerase
MRIFFAGATGVIGRRLLPLLVASGHRVVAMTSSPERAGPLADAGAEPVVCDVFDADAVRAAVVAARPEVVMHQLTRLPATIDPRRLAEAYAPNDRIRREGTANLVAGAEAAGVRRLVAQSVAFACVPADGPVDEDQPLALEAPDPWGNAVRAVAELERRVGGADLEGVVLRYGFFYGPGTSFAPDGQQAAEVRARRLPLIGDGSGVWPMIHVDDAATAAAAALDGGAPGIYNVVDDDPAPAREWLPAYARALGAKPPRRVPAWLARLVAGPAIVSLAQNRARPSNARFRAAFGWEPRYPGWREGFAEGLG